MPIILDGTAGIDNNATDLSYTGTLTGGTGVVNLGSGQVYKDASGNVGIGTSSPGEKLSLTGNFRVDTGYIYFAGNTSTPAVGAGIYRPATDTLGFVINSSERARIDSSGNLLVGKTTTAGTTQGGYISPAGQYVVAQPTATGAVFFQNTSGGATVGAITINASTTTYATSSDYRLKHDIAPMTGALARVALLKPCTYKWNADNSQDEGFIAHELAEVCPSAVSGEKDAVNEDGSINPQGIDTSFLVATLTAAIQELKAINDAQAQTIESLTARVVALEQA